MEINVEYRRGYEDGVKALAERLTNYYEKLKGTTHTVLVVYNIEIKSKEILEELYGKGDNG